MLIAVTMTYQMGVIMALEVSTEDQRFCVHRRGCALIFQQGSLTGWQ